MLHEPATIKAKDYGIEFKTRLGVLMFIIYAAFYAGFVVINVTWPTLMEVTVIFGLNLAVTYGFALIIVALILAIIYNHLCTKKENDLRIEAEGK